MKEALVSDLSFEIAALHEAYASGLSPEDVIDIVFARHEEVGDPGIFIHLGNRDDLKRQAAALGSFDPATRPLWGVPFAVKDNIDSAGMPTTAACPSFSYHAEEDATVVAKLRAAGAIPVGKTNLDQFATGLVGVRTPYPVPKNPFDGACIPGGSSSGSAVAVARGIVSFALGTDTAGSGRIPAGLNNIVGLKPSLGLISTKGVVPACRTLDCVSIFALSTADAWEALQHGAGYDAADPFSKPLPSPQLRDLPKPVRVAVPDQKSRLFFGDDTSEAAFRSALADLKALGFELIETDFGPFFEAAYLLYDGAWVAERYAAIKGFLDGEPDDLHPITAQIIRSAETLSAVDAFRGFYALQALRRRCAGALDQVDVLAVPTVPRYYKLAEIDDEPIEANSRLGTYTNFVNLLDLCGLAVPTRKRGDGLPSGVTFLASSGQDGMLARLGDRLHCAADLKLGATDWTMTGGLPEQHAAEGVRLAVVGAHMRDLPLNHQLKERGGVFECATHTAPCYRLYDLASETPRKPGLLRVEKGGASIELEVWRLTPEAFGDFVAQVPRPMTIGDVTLQDGSSVKGFLVEPAALWASKEITETGGWRAYLASL